MSPSDTTLKARMKRLAQSRGLPGEHTIIIEELTGPIPDIVRDVIRISGVGVPVLLFMRSPELWTLIGTKGISGIHSGARISLEFSEIVDAKSVGPMMDPRMPCEWIELRDRAGLAYVVWAPPGPECIAMLGVLLPFLSK